MKELLVDSSFETLLEFGCEPLIINEAFGIILKLLFLFIKGDSKYNPDIGKILPYVP